MVYINDIKQDNFVFDQTRQMLKGSKTDTTYQLGDEVYVKVKKTDLVKKHLDFTII